MPGITGPGHRALLAEFHAGRFLGSFARSADLQSNPAIGDRRMDGSLASLAGLEAALGAGDADEIQLAAGRIPMGHALIASYGGLPLLYMADEVGFRNDWSYLDDPVLAGDGR